MPDAENSTSRPSDAPAPSRTVVVASRASAIWEAIVRFQISSYSANSSALTRPASSPGRANESPAGRIASWASWAFLTFRSYFRGVSDTKAGP